MLLIISRVMFFAAELVLIGYDSRGASTEQTNQLSETYKKAVLTSGGAASVRDELGVLFGFIVRLYPNTTNTTALRLQIWRPNPGDVTHHLVCEKLLQLPVDISKEADEVYSSSNSKSKVRLYYSAL